MTGPCISAGSPCKEPGKLYVEVAGTAIHPGHGLVLEKNGEPFSALSMEQRQWHQRYECDYAVAAAERFDHTLTLTIEKEQGGTLRLPLLDEPHPTRLSAYTQPNLLLPIYPLAEMPRVEGEVGHALLRPGYLYVFWKGILWRELQTDENGKLRDIDLPHYRELVKSEGPAAVDERGPTGVELDTLWVPARFQTVGAAQWTIGDVELAWSEQQWSWEYVESLESGQEIIHLPANYRELTGIPAYGKNGARAINARRHARCKNLEMLKEYEHRRRFGPDNNSGRDWVSLNDAAPCRRRDPNREKDATNPAVVTQALDGSGLDDDNTPLGKIRYELERMEGFACKAAETVDFASGLTRWVDDLIGEDWRTQFGGGQTTPGTAEATDKSEAARKELLDEVRRRLRAGDSDEDQLSSLRERHIPAVPLPDLLFELEWLTNQTALHLTHLSTVAESAQEHPHFKSAMLVHSAIFDQKGYERRPFDDYRYAVDTEKLDAALRKEDREACRANCYELIERRIRLLENQAVPVFNDLFALNGLRHPVALQTLNPLLTHLETSVFHFDPLVSKVARESEAYRDEAGAEFIKKLARGQTGLSAFLAAEADTEQEQVGEPEPNDGSGRPRPGLLKWLQTQRPAVGDLPEALRDQYELSKQEREKVYENIRNMADPELLQWATASYTTMGQLMADLSSEFYLTTQRALLRNIGNGPIYQITETLQIPTRYMKLGNPFLGGLVLGHANPAMVNPNPEMVPLGIRFGNQAAGIGAFSNETINNALQRSNGAQIVRPKGGVVNRVGLGMSGNYAVIRNGNGKLLANATSVAGLQGSTPTASAQVEMFLAHKDSVAARMSQGFKHRAGTVLMRWAPPGMLGVFGVNVVIGVQALFTSDIRKGLPLKEFTSVLYGGANFLYWLGHIVEAENLVRETRLSWLTRTRLEVDKMDNGFLKSAARRLFADRVLSIAKFAGVAGAALEVLLSLWEGVQRLQANDMDAAAGYFTAAAGFGLFMFSHLAGTGLVPILGVSFAAALAAVALFVALAALAWAILNTDDALETWLKHGPFGKEEPASQYQHLHSEPENAFQFLVGGLFPLSGNSFSLAELNDRGLLSDMEKDWLLDNDSTEGHVITVRSAAFALMDRPEEQFQAHFWMTWRHGGKVKALTPEFVYYDAERQMLRFHLPKPQWRGMGRFRSMEQLRAKVQIALGNGGLLPVSDIEQPLALAVDEPTHTGKNPRWLTITS